MDDSSATGVGSGGSSIHTGSLIGRTVRVGEFLNDYLSSASTMPKYSGCE